MKNRLPRWAKWLAGVGGVVVLVVAGFALWLAASLSGGIDNVLDFRHPEPNDGRVVRAGEEALVDARERAAELAAAASAAAPELGPFVGTTGATECDQGQHNWKIDDEYDLRCTARGVAALQPDADAVARAVHAFAETLRAEGWVDEGPPRVFAMSGADVGVGGVEVGSLTRRGERVLLRVLSSRGTYAGDTRLTDLPPFRSSDGSEIAPGELPTEASEGRCTLLLEVQRVYFDE